ncbi:MAG: hypothetical protein KGL39_09750 [Patescibacteria group bacterium]|nr:hypothetical protein [Patescibacteria group bacterium]
MGAAFLIPAAMTLASAGAQYVNQSNAQSRQNAAEAQDIINQQRIGSQGAADVSRLTQQIANDNPNQIAADATAQYVNTLRKNAAGSMQGGSTTGAPTLYGQSTSAVGQTAGADPRFKADLANDQQQVEDYGNQYAKEMGAVDAAVRQRQNEGLDMQTLGTQLGLLDAQSWGQNFVDSLRAQAAGQQNPWVAMAANMLGRGANAYATNHVPTSTIARQLGQAGNQDVAQAMLDMGYGY